MRRPDVFIGGAKPSEAQWRRAESHNKRELASLRPGSVSSEDTADAPPADLVPIDLEGRRVVFPFTSDAQVAGADVEPLGVDPFCSEASSQAMGEQLDRAARELESAVPGRARRSRSLSLEGLVAHEAAVEASDVSEEWAGYAVGKADQG